MLVTDQYPIEKQRVGVGLRPPYYKQFQLGPPATVSWVEVVSENYMGWSQRNAESSLDNLLKVRTNIPVSLHGVSLSIGSTDPLRKDYLIKLKELITLIEPVSVTDHLCWTGRGGINSHDLLPLPYNNETIKYVSERIDLAQNFLSRKICLENISSYLQFGDDPLAEAEVLAEIVKKTGCGLLLDVNNVYVNSVNHHFDPITYLARIPMHKVCHLHLAGHSRKEGLCVDTHDTPVCGEVWELYKYIESQNPDLPVMLERDGKYPEWKELEEELLQIHRLKKESHVNAETVATGV